MAKEFKPGSWGEFVTSQGFPWDHVDYVCNGDCHDDSICMFCAGGLFACVVCGSFEGATTSQCPKRTMTADERDAVYAGFLDFRHGEWLAETSYHCPGGFIKYYVPQEPS